MMSLQLSPAQIDAVNRMRDGCILCSDTGSGKSRTSLAYYYTQYGGQLGDGEYVHMHDPPDLYIITTAKKRDDKEWETELSHFLLTKDKDKKLYSHTITIDSWNNIKKYKDVAGAFFIFDEDRVTGNGTWVKSFLKIAKYNRWILLSATPGDKYEDYIPVFIANGFYRNRTEFKDEHLNISTYAGYPQITGYRNTGRLNRLRRRILVNMDYRHPAEQHHDDIWVEYDREKYKDIIRYRWDPWKDQPIENASEYCYALRKVCNEDQSRVVRLLELFEKHPRIIIFYNFDYELALLQDACTINGIPYAEWNGHKHQNIPEGMTWAYLVNYAAGAEGWNCTLTDTIIFYSQNYSYRMTVQAAGRIDRANTPFRDLYYYHFKSRSGIDLAIAEALKKKKKFNELNFMAS